MKEFPDVPVEFAMAYQKSIHEVWVRLHTVAHMLERESDLIQPEYWKPGEDVVPDPADSIGLILLDVAKTMKAAWRKLSDALDDRRKQQVAFDDGKSAEPPPQNPDTDIPGKAIYAFDGKVYSLYIRLHGLGYVLDKNSERLELGRMKAGRKTPDPGEGLGLLVLDVAEAIHRASKKFDDAVNEARASRERLLAESRHRRGST